jgi:hypothetical protein
MASFLVLSKKRSHLSRTNDRLSRTNESPRAAILISCRQDDDSSIAKSLYACPIEYKVQSPLTLYRWTLVAWTQTTKSIYHMHSIWTVAKRANCILISCRQPMTHRLRNHSMPGEYTNYKVHSLFIAGRLPIGHKIQSP